MSYDVYTVRALPGEDAEDRLDELLESWEEPTPEDDVARQSETVSALVDAYLAAFPGAEVVEQEATSATVLLHERHVSVDVHADYCAVELSYAEPRTGDWLIELIEAVRRVGAVAGQQHLIDPQVGSEADPARDRDAMIEGYEGGLAMIAQLRERHEGGGRLRRLFRRG